MFIQLSGHLGLRNKKVDACTIWSTAKYWKGRTHDFHSTHEKVTVQKNNMRQKAL